MEVAFPPLDEQKAVELLQVPDASRTGICQCGFLLDSWAVEFLPHIDTLLFLLLLLLHTLPLFLFLQRNRSLMLLFIRMSVHCTCTDIIISSLVDLLLMLFLVCAFFFSFSLLLLLLLLLIRLTLNQRVGGMWTGLIGGLLDLLCIQLLGCAPYGDLLFVR